MYVPLTKMLPVCLIIAVTIGRPNPFSFGGARNERFDPSRPGIVRVTRHPLLLALALWAAAHVAPNGDLAHGVLFGTFAAFALLGGCLIDRRRQREMGTGWHRLLSKVGPVAYLCRPKCSFRPLSVRRRPGFSSPVLSAAAADCRSH